MRRQGGYLKRYAGFSKAAKSFSWEEVYGKRFIVGKVKKGYKRKVMGNGGEKDRQEGRRVWFGNLGLRCRFMYRL